MKITLFGLGVMGEPMARHLINAGHDLTVYSRSIQKAQGWVEENGGYVCSTPQEGAENAECVIVILRRDDDLQDLLFDQGVIASMKPGALLIDHTTASPGMAIAIAQHAMRHSVAFSDAPVSGGDVGARHGTLSVMMGCEEAVEAKLHDLFSAYAKQSVRIGEAGSGQTAKAINQVCIVGVIQALAEGLELARRSGIETDRLLAALRSGAAGSWQMTNRAEAMLRQDFKPGFASTLMRKDLGIAADLAASLDLNAPMLSLAIERYDTLIGQGLGELDNTSLMLLLAGNYNAAK